MRFPSSSLSVLSCLSLRLFILAEGTLDNGSGRERGRGGRRKRRIEGEDGATNRCLTVCVSEMDGEIASLCRKTPRSIVNCLYSITTTLLSLTYWQRSTQWEMWEQSLSPIESERALVFMCYSSHFHSLLLVPSSFLPFHHGSRFHPPHSICCCFRKKITLSI